MIKTFPILSKLIKLKRERERELCVVIKSERNE